MRLLAFAAVLSCSFACHAVRSSGRPAQDARELPPFDSVEVRGGIHVVATTGPARPVRIEADDDVVPQVEARVESGRLVLGMKRHWNGWDIGDVQVTVQQPRFVSLEASGGASIDATLAQTDELSLSSSGGGVVVARGIDARKLNAETTGGARLELIGVADELSLRFSGGARLRAKALHVRAAQVSGSGGCSGELEASESLRGRLSGGCSLRLHGQASSRVKTSGGASIDWDD